MFTILTLNTLNASKQTISIDLGIVEQVVADWETIPFTDLSVRLNNESCQNIFDNNN